jgi:hypothetical protein
MSDPGAGRKTGATRHVHVMGDIAELQLVRIHDELPDQYDPSLAAYRRLRGVVRRSLQGGTWSVAKYVRAALNDLWKTELSWSGLVKSIRGSDHSSNDLIEETSERTANGRWVVSVTTSDLQTTQKSEEPKDVIENREAKFEGFDVDVETSEIVAQDSNIKIGPRRGVEIETTVEPDYLLDSIAVHQFSGGSVIAEVSCLTDTPGDFDSIASKLALPMKIGDSRPGMPTIHMWPKCNEIKFAIRQIDLKATEKSARDYFRQVVSTCLEHAQFKSLAKKRKLQIVAKCACLPHVSDIVKKTAKEFALSIDIGDISEVGIEGFAGDEEDNGNPKLVLPEAIWQALLIEEKLPLETFFKIDSGNETSRAVLLVDREWCRSSDGKDSHDSTTHVGYMVFKGSRRDWVMWLSRHKLALGGKDMLLSGSRLLLELPKADDEFFCLPLSAHMARLFEPNQRPSRGIKRPLAVVTTTEWPGPQEPGAMTVRPIWTVMQYEGKDGVQDPFRLKSPDGYQVEPDWYRESIVNRRRWVELFGDSVESGQHDRNIELLSAIDWGLKRTFRHGELMPQWVPPGIIENVEEFKHLVVSDLDFGFRRFWMNLKEERQETKERLNPKRGGQTTGDGKTVSHFAERHHQFQEELKIFVEEVEKQQSEPNRPDWWYPLMKWAKAGRDGSRDNRGWLLAILGRQLPIAESIDDPNSQTAWDRHDMWNVLRFSHWWKKNNDTNSHLRPIFRDRMVVIVSGNLLRASSAMISQRLSWERTASDCVRELKTNARFQPLTEFRYLVVRFGLAGAVLVSRNELEGGQVDLSYQLFFDAAAKNGFHRDPPRKGTVLGANSVFAGTLLRHLLDDSPEKQKLSERDSIAEGIREAINSCQKIYDAGYGKSFEEHDRYRLQYCVPEAVMAEWKS